MKTKGIFFLYRFLQAIGLPVLLLYFVLRGFRNRGYWRSLPQRFGFLPHSYRQNTAGAIWLHAVSVGEVLACVELVRRLRADFPRSAVFVSTTTLAGYGIADQKLREIAHGVFYAPVDYVFAVRRVLRFLRPALVLIAETEVWPNLFREAKRTGAGLAVFNARISNRAFPRYQSLRSFFESVLPAADVILAQTERDRERFIATGAAREQVRVAGNLKFDFEPKSANASSPVVAWVERLRPAPLWIAASTMPPADEADVDEDDAVIAAFREMNVPLILAPRKPERFDIVAGKLEAAGISYVRRTRLDSSETPKVLLLDTIGELSGLFGLADVVFMGGTLARRGGHNILEPAFYGKPVIVGPHMENFQVIADEFRAAGGCVEIPDSAALPRAVARLIGSRDEAVRIGARGRATAEGQRGATSRVVQEVRQLYGIPCYRPAQPWYALRWGFAQLWCWGGRRRMAKGLAAQRRLDVPVVIVGNLTMGGTGKTPCVLRLVEVWKDQGRKPGILTRGYGRRSMESTLAIAAGATVRTEETGDESRLFINSGLAPVGIGTDRWKAGVTLRQHFDVDIMAVDDGFQHARLARDVDIVLVDALDPFGGGYVFPLGRLREPAVALARANIIVIARSDLSDSAPAIERAVRKWNREAPVYRSRIEPRAWVAHPSRREHSVSDPPFRRPGAFCGLGNPQSFRRTLERLGVTPVGWFAFGDHHRYRPHEVRRIAKQLAALGADAVVTTEKDIVNLCEGCEALVAPLRLFWLKTDVRIEAEASFFEEIRSRLP